MQTTAKALRLYGSIRFKADRQMTIYLVRRRDLSMGLVRVGAHGQKKNGTELGAALGSVVALACLRGGNEDKKSDVRNEMVIPSLLPDKASVHSPASMFLFCLTWHVDGAFRTSARDLESAALSALALAPRFTDQLLAPTTTSVHH